MSELWKPGPGTAAAIADAPRPAPAAATRMCRPERARASRARSAAPVAVPGIDPPVITRASAREVAPEPCPACAKSLHRSLTLVANSPSRVRATVGVHAARFGTGRTDSQDRMDHDSLA